jgi:surface polysaccharide O-acyltransferase-like enzyme
VYLIQKKIHYHESFFPKYMYIVVLDALATKEKYHGKMKSVVSTDAAILDKLKTIFDKYIRYEIKCLTYTVFMLWSYDKNV